MNQKKKYVGLLAILPLFMVTIAPYYITEADALLAGGTPVTNVLGATPDIQSIDVINFSGESPQTFKAIYKITSGNEDLENVQILFVSDKSSVHTVVDSLVAHSSSINNVIIQAQDPSSVTAEIINYEINS